MLYNKTTGKITMKAVCVLLTGLSVLTLARSGYSQTGTNEFRNDPTYSTHNYKHANKAALARRWEGESGLTIAAPTDARLADYKKSLPSLPASGGIVVGHRPSVNLADRNYKIQRISEPAGPTGDRVVKQRKRRSDSTSVIGN